MKLLVGMAALVALGASISCSSASDPCAEARANASAASADWRQRISDSLSTVADSDTVEAAFFFVAEVSEADRSFVSSVGGVVVYEFRGFPALVARITAVDLRSMAASSDYARLAKVELGLPVYPMGTC